MSNEFWVLYDPNQKMQTEKMSTEEAQFSLLKMKTKEINHFLIWRNEWPKWKRLKDFLNDDASPFMSTFLNKKEDNDSSSQKSSLQMKPVDKETEKNIQASFSNVQLEEKNIRDVFTVGQEQFDPEKLSEDLDSSKSNLDFSHLNKATAFGKSSKDDQYKLELLLIHPKGQMFRSIAQNISLSGTFSEKIVPDEFHRDPFDLVIINNFINDAQYNRLTLKARVVITDSSLYLEYIKPSDQQKESLRAILDYYVRSLKKIQN